MGKVKLPLYKHIANVCHCLNCVDENYNNIMTRMHWLDILSGLEKLLPSGSGVDSGCKVDIENSSSEKIVIESSYNLMNQQGYYTRLIDFHVNVRPILTGENINLHIVGNFGREQDLKDYLYDLFFNSLTQLV